LEKWPLVAAAPKAARVTIRGGSSPCPATCKAGHRGLGVQDMGAAGPSQEDDVTTRSREPGPFARRLAFLRWRANIGRDQLAERSGVSADPTPVLCYSTRLQRPPAWSIMSARSQP
jgi:hypothetical protein